MSEALPDKIILGHNAFFGVDHLSAARGAQRATQFAEVESILEIIRIARSLGAGGLMMSTHEKAQPVARLMLQDPGLKEDFRLYPLLPYAQKYVTRANEVGMINLVWEALAGPKVGNTLGMVFKGAKGVLAKDINSILGALIRLELKPFEKLGLQVVFLHDVFTDLALALELPDIFHFYLEEIKKVYGCQGGFATKNLPRFLECFQAWGISEPVVMTHFNKAGFHMNPSRQACEEAAAAHPAHVLAMGSLASGYLAPDEAYEYLGGVPQVEAVVVGVSSPEHARESFKAIQRNLT
ncbi:MAG: hypothetical protein PVG03_15475 [Desulfarculaceae bacterium]|jgi:hypothetical protein